MNFTTTIKHIFILLIFISNTKYLLSETPYSFKVDKFRLNKALLLINDFENKINNGTLSNKSVLSGVEMTEIIEDLRFLLSHPNSSKIGNNGHYCGTAAILNWFINNRPEQYSNTILNLAYYGKARVTNDSPLIKVPKQLKSKIDYSIIEKNENFVIRNDIDSTSISDFMLCVSLVNSEKFIQKIGLIHPQATYNKKSIGSFIYTITMPWEMDDYFKKIGIQIEDKAYYRNKKNKQEELFKIQKAVQEGKMPIIFDNHYISYTSTRNFLYKTLGAHFITIHSFEIDKNSNTVNFTYWDYGSVKSNPFLNLKKNPVSTGNISKDMKALKKYRKKGLHKREKRITIDEFITAMKGYWIPEI